MAKPKTKTKAVAAAQSRDEVAVCIAKIGEIGREIARREADFGDAAAKLKADHLKGVEPLQDSLAELQTRVQGWCEANRSQLTQGGKVKFAKFSTGEVKWRAAPPSISIRGVAAVLEALKASAKLKRFIRTKEEINKDAMLAEPELAQTVAGVTVVSGVEDFVVEPFEPELVERAA